MKHVAIYLTNTDRSEFAAGHLNDAEKVVERLRGAGADYRFTVFDVTQSEFADDPTGFDAVILTGSPAHVDDNEPWIAPLMRDIRALVGAKTPLVGLCFGHQAIVAAFGGKVVRKDFWIFGASEFTVFATRPWMDPPREKLKLYAANKAQALVLPDGFDLLGGSEICPIGLSALENHVFTTQFHPEMSDEFITALVDEYAEYLGPETTDIARASIKTPAEGDLFGRWICNFIDLPRG